MGRAALSALLALAVAGRVRSASLSRPLGDVELLPVPSPAPADKVELADSGAWKSNFHAWKGKGGDASRSGYSPVYAAPTELGVPAWTRSWRDQRLLMPTSGNYASPSVDGDGNVYMPTMYGSVLKLSATGEVMWEVTLVDDALLGRLPGKLAANAFSRNLATLALAQDQAGKLVAYVTPQFGYWAWALDCATGAVRWRTTFGVGPTYQTDGWSNAAASGVLVTSGLGEGATSNKEGNVGTATIFALNATTGAHMWSHTIREVGMPFNFLPAIINEDKPRPSLLYEGANGAVYRHDLRSGQIIWRVPSPALFSFSTAGCAVDVSGSGIAVCASVNQTYRAAVHFAGTPDRAREGGIVRAFDLRNGNKLWEWRSTLPAEAGPAIAHGYVYVGVGRSGPFGNFSGGSGSSERGWMTALSLSTGHIVWQRQTDELNGLGAGNRDGLVCLPDAFSTPVVGADGTVYFGWQGGLVYALDGQSGAYMSSCNVEHGIPGGLALGPSAVYVATCDALHAFRK